MPAVARLSDDEVRAALRELPGWEGDAAAIRKGFRFRGFRAAIAFVDRVADEAVAARHHPDIDVRYDRVTIVLTTHDEDGVTDADVALARVIERATVVEG
jgi:4a-hydroxytetrahydrobiopterin dehydratase